ncbi:hypothetical protein FHR81_001594 [Actinoalloteichus hoggarensis]|uniref:Uncharacterized protein n=1 Tax=Actinoalloteichus hoggarensis TaxID=1470176 RepID=A0A221W0L6_9PSEU|nr:hypothetical protein AHOG_08405 [Actinoalloteichus hoggarensis]MBB5920564.1 hypothetical protein [Actinoalloteichus hoggarensis]
MLSEARDAVEVSAHPGSATVAGRSEDRVSARVAPTEVGRAGFDGVGRAWGVAAGAGPVEAGPAGAAGKGRTDGRRTTADDAVPVWAVAAAVRKPGSGAGAGGGAVGSDVAGEAVAAGTAGPAIVPAETARGARVGTAGTRPVLRVGSAGGGSVRTGTAGFTAVRTGTAWWNEAARTGTIRTWGALMPRGSPSVGSNASGSGCAHAAHAAAMPGAGPVRSRRPVDNSALWTTSTTCSAALGVASRGTYTAGCGQFVSRPTSQCRRMPDHHDDDQARAPGGPDAVLSPCGSGRFARHQGGGPPGSSRQPTVRAGRVQHAEHTRWNRLWPSSP